MMRIITGKARGVKLITPQGLVTRPTAERTKEAIFSVLQFSLVGKRVLDLFGGSGQMGLEAVSRGAAHAVILDSSREALQAIGENVRRTKLESETTVLAADALQWLAAYRGEPFDIVFLDPPYALGLLPRCLTLLLREGVLRDGAIVVTESAENDDVFAGDASLQARFCQQRQARYGAAFVNVLTVKREVEK